MKPRYYKWTDAQGRSCHNGSHDWVADPTCAVKGKVVPCRNGVHVATAEQALRHLWLTARCAEVVRAVGLEDLGDKAVARSVTVGRWCLTPGLLQLWAADCAERVLHRYEAQYPADPRPRRAIEAARQYACGVLSAAAGDAARAAARDAAWAAARDAAWAAAGAAAGDAAGDAAWAAAGAAAGAAARAAAWAAARAAARDAEIEWQAARLQAYLDGWLPLPAEPYRAHLMELPR